MQLDISNCVEAFAKHSTVLNTRYKSVKVKYLLLVFYKLLFNKRYCNMDLECFCGITECLFQRTVEKNCSLCKALPHKDAKFLDYSKV